MVHSAKYVFEKVNSDPRHWQILALSILCLLSNIWSGFGSGILALLAAISGCLITQCFGTLITQAPWQWKSAVITALSLSILLRAGSPWVWFFAGCLGILLKFVVRWNGKHLFNPACIGIVTAIAFTTLFDTELAWISPGQWGQIGWFIGLATGCAALVLSSAKRLDIALGFLGFVLAIGIGRALWLGDPLTIPLHKIQNGAILVFAFFMVTDPRSTPNSRMGRLLFAFCVAILAAWLSWQFHLRGAMLYALILSAPMTPFLDHFWRSSKVGHC